MINVEVTFMLWNIEDTAEGFAEHLTHYVKTLNKDQITKLLVVEAKNG